MRNLVVPLIELAETKYADNVAVAALVRSVKTERVVALATADLPQASVDLLAGYINGVKGTDGYYPPSRFEPSAIDFEIKRMNALARFGIKFECLVVILEALGETIEW